MSINNMSGEDCALAQKTVRMRHQAASIMPNHLLVCFKSLVGRRNAMIIANGANSAAEQAIASSL